MADTKTYKKIDDNTIEVTKNETFDPEITVTNYKRDFLLNQRASIIKQANDFLSERQKELAEVDELIAECDKLGIEQTEIVEKLK